MLNSRTVADSLASKPCASGPLCPAAPSLKISSASPSWAPLPEAPTPVGRRGAAIIPFPSTDHGPETRKTELIKLLFVCRTHAVLSPMAEGLAEAAYERLDISVQSAGLSPAAVDRRAVAAMAEIGIDISQACTTAVRDLDLGSFDIVVSLGVHKLGLHPRQMAVAWDIPEFTRVTEATAWPRLRQVRDAISVRVSALGAILTATNRA
jgi:arsenate reductase